MVTAGGCCRLLRLLRLLMLTVASLRMVTACGCCRLLRLLMLMVSPKNSGVFVTLAPPSDTPVPMLVLVHQDPNCEKAVAAAAGVHIVLPGYFTPGGMGLCNLRTKRGATMYFLPWQVPRP